MRAARLPVLAALASAAMVAGGTGTAAAGSSGSLAVEVPGEVPAFTVGPVDDGDPATPDPVVGRDGVRNVTVSVQGSSDSAPVLTASAGGAATTCPDDARVDQVFKVGSTGGGSLSVVVEYEKVGQDGTVTSEHVERDLHSSDGRVVKVPVCII